MGPEARLERKVCGAVKRLGGLAIKLQGTAGMPDRLCVTPGADGPGFTFVEMKADAGRVSEKQKIMKARLSDLGCDVRIVRGVDATNDLIRDLTKMVKGGDA